MVKAVVLCRVSTAEQLQSNSLNRQEQNVVKAAKELGVDIIKSWSGDVSSKVGKNIKRKDLLEIQEFCKNNHTVKFLIVDEVDRFMRSIGEMFYWIESFKMIGVKVYFASNKELNDENSRGKLLLSLDGFKAEGSNEERIHKSIDGHRKAVEQGRRTFPPLPGYTKSIKPGVHGWHKTESEPWQQALKEVSSKMYTPSEAMKRLNNTEFINNRPPMRIDKFLRFIVNPFYCGVVEIKGQINTRCEIGQHKPMITQEEHKSILEVVDGRAVRNIRKQQYNPEFPLNKILLHDCEPGAKFTGSFQSNGKGHKYAKYRCRKCNKQYHRSDINKAVDDTLNKFELNKANKEELIKALTLVWHQKQQDIIKTLKTLQKRSDRLQEEKSKLYRELANTSEEFKQGIQDEIRRTEAKLKELESEISKASNFQEDMVEFVAFALEYTNRLAKDWWELNQQERFQCQQLLFPDGIVFNSDKKVSTHSISPLYRLNSIKKDLRINRKSLLVELVDNNWHHVIMFTAYWRELLYYDYHRWRLLGGG